MSAPRPIAFHHALSCFTQLLTHSTIWILASITALNLNFSLFYPQEVQKIRSKMVPSRTSVPTC